MKKETLFLKRLPGLTTILFKLEGVDESFDLEKFSLFIKDETGKDLAKLHSSEKAYFVYKPLGYNVEIPVEIEEQLNSNAKKEIFGNAALDVSSDIESVYFGSNKTNPNSNDLLKVEKNVDFIRKLMKRVESKLTPMLIQEPLINTI